MQLPAHDRYDHSAIIHRPTYAWPNGAHLALLIVNNIEHFAYRQGLGSDSTGPALVQNQRPYAWRDYGNRVGLWNLLALLDELALPAAHNCNAAVLDHCPEIAPALLARGDELIGHGRTNSERQDGMGEAEERALIEESRDTLTRHGARPRGWLGPYIAQSAATLDLLAEAGFTYCLDWPADDQP
ncbi:MAG: polysaccharide deacetylase family protein, partial [Gemmatimonadaceae bacterium]|nr:polysaccharide deacetylase family protein [Acetobacteraceae bacterium]